MQESDTVTRLNKLKFTTRLADSEEQPMYTNHNYGVPLDLEVLPAYFPDAPAQ